MESFNLWPVIIGIWLGIAALIAILFVATRNKGG